MRSSHGRVKIKPYQTRISVFCVRTLASSWTDRWLVGLIVASLLVPPAYYGLVAYQSRVATYAAADRQLVGMVRTDS